MNWIVYQMRSFTAWQLTYQYFLFWFHLNQTLQLHVEPLQFCLLFIEIIVQFHHFSLSVFGLALPLVSLAQGSQLLLFNFDCKLVKALGQRRHVFIKRDNFSDELHRKTFEMIGLSEFFRVQHSDVVLLIEGDWEFVCHLNVTTIYYAFKFKSNSN